MKFYKDSVNVYWIGNTSVPAGVYRLDVNDAKTIVSIYPFDIPTQKNLPTIYNILVTDFEDESGTPYADWDEFYSAVSGFFANASGDGGFTLDPNPPEVGVNRFTGVDQAAAESDRDVYFAANPNELAKYDNDALRLIVVDWNGEGGSTFEYQSRAVGQWVSAFGQFQGTIDLGTHSVTELADVTSEGSGAIITDAERNAISTLLTDTVTLVTEGDGISVDNTNPKEPNISLAFPNVRTVTGGIVSNTDSLNPVIPLPAIPLTNNRLMRTVDNDGTVEWGQVNNQLLNNESVSTAKIQDSAVTPAKLSEEYATITQLGNTNGYATYIDSAGATTPREYISDTRTLLINDKTHDGGSRYPNGVTSFWDSSTSKFTPDQADGIYAFTVNFTSNPSIRDKRVLVEFIAEGAGFSGGDIQILSRLIRLNKDAGETTQVSVSFTQGFPQEIITSGITVYISFEETDSDIYDISCSCAKLNAEII